MKEDNPEILKDYTFIKDIGEGNFGKVKLSILKATNEQYAIKILNKQKLKSQTKSSSFNEIEIISKLNHPNIIHVEKIIEDNENYYIIMEYCINGELFDYIVNKEKLGYKETSIFFYQLINGVEYIHKQNFAHRDLKPENLLLTKDNKLKIIDFGLCHDFNGTKLLKTKCGSPSYAAPEILLGYPYDGFKTDIWCCGIILYGMLCGYLPFDGDDNQEIFKQIVECNPEYPSFLEDDCIDLLIGILNPEPKDRLSINQIKNHNFYLKGKKNYLIKYKEKFEIENKNNEENINKNIVGNYNSVDKKDYIYSSIRKQQEGMQTYNKIKTLKAKKNRNFKNNIYQNIFDNIIYDDEENEKLLNLNNNTDNNNSHTNNLSINNKNDVQNDKESEKYDKAEKRKINEIAVLSNNIKNTKPMAETEGNENKPPLILRTFRNKLKENHLKLNSNKLQLKNNINNNNNNSFNKRLDILNYYSNPNNTNSNSKNKEQNNKKGLSLDINILNIKTSDNNRHDKIFLKKYGKNNNIRTDTISNNLKEKHNIKELKLKTLDFLQKFLINKKNQIENNVSTPSKNNEINFNLILTKTKENKNRQNDNETLKNRHLSIKKTRINPETRVIFTQKKRKVDSANKKIIINSEIKLVNSPNSINKCQNYNKYDQYFANINNINNNEEGCRTFSIKKRNHKNIKINKKFNLKIINFNDKENQIKKEARNNYVKSYPNNRRERENIKEIVFNNKNINLNGAFKTEPKYNHFLDNVIQKINSKNNQKNTKNNINIVTFNNKYKNEDNKQVFKLLNPEKHNNDLACPYLIKYYRNNSNEGGINKKSPIHFKDEKKFLLSINPRILENNMNSKEKLKRVFPNLSIYNKNL